MLGRRNQVIVAVPMTVGKQSPKSAFALAELDSAHGLFLAKPPGRPATHGPNAIAKAKSQSPLVQPGAATAVIVQRARDPS